MTSENKNRDECRQAKVVCSDIFPCFKSLFSEKDVQMFTKYFIFYIKFINLPKLFQTFE